MIKNKAVLRKFRFIIRNFQLIFTISSVNINGFLDTFLIGKKYIFIAEE